MAENGDSLNPEEKCKLITRNLQVRSLYGKKLKNEAS